MKIEKITIQNYRCFKNLEIRFTNGVNILIGKNGTGKSTIINALRHIMSFLFAGNPGLKKDHPLYAFFASAEGLTINSQAVQRSRLQKRILLIFSNRRCLQFTRIHILM